jgi:hypothetical protein
MSAESARRRATTWKIAISRGSEPHDGDTDLDGLRISRDLRARLTWDLSCELYSLARRNQGVFDEETGTFVAVEEGPLERRLPRAAFVITRR